MLFADAVVALLALGRGKGRNIYIYIYYWPHKLWENIHSRSIEGHIQHLSFRQLVARMHGLGLKTKKSFF